ncbi:MAG: tyrosine-type recombinase/integrase [Xanthobacteraceae bacterium]
MARAKHGSYVFQRPGSANWWILLRDPGGKRIEKTLKTPDRRQAEILALPLIAAHKAALLAARPRLELTRYKLDPGEYHTDGERVIATERDLIYFDGAGKLLRTEPNGPAQRLVNLPMGAVITYGEAPPTRVGPVIDLSKLATASRNGDDEAIIETYLKHANVTGYYEREARAVWTLYQQLTNNKPLKNADRDDGRKLVAHFEGEGLRSATIQKKIGWLTAAVNLAIKEGRLKFNPFASIVPKRDDKQKRLPLNDADMKECKRNLDKIDGADSLLFRLLATTGMRLSEAFEIDGEEKEKGCRYIIVGKKTEQSLRRVPLPTALLPHLPKIIKGPLFMNGNEAAASKRLNRFLNDCGIVDPRKVVHSLRHRAQDRLRAAGCPEDIRWAILGHEEKTVASGYGEGFPVTVLRKWVDKIGG